MYTFCSLLLWQNRHFDNFQKRQCLYELHFHVFLKLTTHVCSKPCNKMASTSNRKGCPTLSYLLSWTSCMFSIPMALLLLELNGPDFLRVGLFPGILKDYGEITFGSDFVSTFRWLIGCYVSLSWKALLVIAVAHVVIAMEMGRSLVESPICSPDQPPNRSSEPITNQFLFLL